MTDSIREQTFGERAVGVTFNPSGLDAVGQCKSVVAALIDQLNDMRELETATPEQKRLASIAITEAQSAQMWAVKALTWQD